MTRRITLPLGTTTAPERAPLVIRHVTRSQARRFVADHHSHHDPHVGEIFAFGAFVGHSLVGVEVIGRPVAPALDDSETWEITRQTVGPGAPRFTSSRLHGAAGRMARVFGVGLITYTRIDEPGRSLLAANFHPEAIAIGRAHDTGNRAARWLPGLYEPSTEIVNRVRWRLGGSRGPLGWDGQRWRSTIRSTSPIRGSDCRAAEVKDEDQGAIIRLLSLLVRAPTDDDGRPEIECSRETLVNMAMAARKELDALRAKTKDEEE